MQSGILYMVGTPIGNLADITVRALETLKEVDLIVAEDTRNTKRLLERHNISTATFSLYGQGRGAQKPRPRIEEIINFLKEGKKIALVTDAGTPGLADPGNIVVEQAILNDLPVIPIPGVSALTTLVSVSGIDLTRFSFWGFPPHKKGRETFFKKVIATEMPVIYYESPHRFLKNLALMKSLGITKKFIVGRELTKMFEEIVRGEVSEIEKYFLENKEKMKGEFVIIVY